MLRALPAGMSRRTLHLTPGPRLFVTNTRDDTQENMFFHWVCHGSSCCDTAVEGSCIRMIADDAKYGLVNSG